MFHGIDLLRIQDRLELERSNLLRDIQREKDLLDVYAEENRDPLDLADRTRNRQSAQRRIEYLEKWLTNTDAALKRIQQGSYGICVQCSKPIRPERLEAIPAAIYCINCQEKVEERSY